ncbi:MAG: hypothetical protein ACODAJ_00605, partial [Planctomycetota bacterium]
LVARRAQALHRLLVVLGQLGVDRRFLGSHGSLLWLLGWRAYQYRPNLSTRHRKRLQLMTRPATGS